MNENTDEECIFTICAVASIDKSISIWTSVSLQPFLLLKSFNDESYTDLSWSPDSSRLLISSNDGKILCLKFQFDTFPGIKLEKHEQDQYNIQQTQQILNDIPENISLLSSDSDQDEPEEQQEELQEDLVAINPIKNPIKNDNDKDTTFLIPKVRRKSDKEKEEDINLLIPRSKTSIKKTFVSSTTTTTTKQVIQSHYPQLILKPEAITLQLQKEYQISYKIWQKYDSIQQQEEVDKKKVEEQSPKNVLKVIVTINKLTTYQSIIKFYQNDDLLWQKTINELISHIELNNLYLIIITRPLAPLDVNNKQLQHEERSQLSILSLSGVYLSYGICLSSLVYSLHLQHDHLMLLLTN